MLSLTTTYLEARCYYNLVRASSGLEPTRAARYLHAVFAHQ